MALSGVAKVDAVDEVGVLALVAAVLERQDGDEEAEGAEVHAEIRAGAGGRRAADGARPRGHPDAVVGVGGISTVATQLSTTLPVVKQINLQLSTPGRRNAAFSSPYLNGRHAARLESALCTPQIRD